MAPVLGAVAYCDLRYMRIPNSLCLVGLGLFALSILVYGPTGLVAKLVISGVVFALGFLGFCLRMIGGGDVKILAVLMLFIPVQTLQIYSYVFSGSMILGIMFILSMRRLAVTDGSMFKSMSADAGFPMGISIGLSGILHPFVVMLLLHQ